MSMKNKLVKEFVSDVTGSNAIKVPFDRGQLVIGVHDCAANDRERLFAWFGKPGLIKIDKSHQSSALNRIARQTPWPEGAHSSASRRFVLRQVQYRQITA